jgi:hypothetical protein
MDSPPLHRYLHALGRVQHHLHTIIVGLSAVEGGIATKPVELDVTWKANDPRNSAREARHFLLQSTVVFAAEEFHTLATSVLRYRELKIPGVSRDRISVLAANSKIENSYLYLGPLIVRDWRNRIIHRDSNAELTKAERQELAANAETIRENYKGIDVERLLTDFKLNKPTLKEVTVLLAMSIKFARQVDALIPEITSSAGVRRWLESEGLTSDVLRLEKEAQNGGRTQPRARAKQLLLTKAPTLVTAYETYGADL